MTTATCPVCNGTTREPALATDRYRHVTSGYDAVTDTHECNNCGRQYMFGRARGTVRTRPDGTACTHQYVQRNVGRCLTEYTCQHCADRYQIDSGD